MSYLVRIARAVLTPTTTQNEQFVGPQGRPTLRKIDAMRYTDRADAATEADLWTNGTVLFECETKCCLFEVTPEGFPAHDPRTQAPVPEPAVPANRWACLKCGNWFEFIPGYGNRTTPHADFSMNVCDGELIPESDPRYATAKRGPTPAQTKALHESLQRAIDKATLKWPR